MTGGKSGEPVSQRKPVQVDPQVHDLTMILLYLTRWTEQNLRKLRPGEEVAWRAWKGHDWAALDKLQEEGLIAFSYRAKSLGLTEQGEREARRLLRKYGFRPSSDGKTTDE